MNTLMWGHPITAKHTTALSELGYIQVPPATKLLACGDYGWFAVIGATVHVIKEHKADGMFIVAFCYFVGIGAMASVDDIVQAVLERLKKDIP